MGGSRQAPDLVEPLRSSVQHWSVIRTCNPLDLCCSRTSSKRSRLRPRDSPHPPLAGPVRSSNHYTLTVALPASHRQTRTLSVDFVTPKVYTAISRDFFLR